MIDLEDGPPDTVLLGGSLHTVNPRQPAAEAVAIRDGIICALGSSSRLSQLCGPSTRTIDLRGRMVMPGLIDGHCHPAKGATAKLFGLRFEFSASPDTIARALREYLARQPEAEFVLGGRWASDFFDVHDLPSPRAWLDRCSQGKAVYLRDDSGHNGWANTKALELAGLNRHSPDPPGGKVLREKVSGEPNGLLLEEADTNARKRFPDWTGDQYRSGVREMVRIANRYGITGVTDADAEEAVLDAYQVVDRDGGLHLRVAASISTPYGHRETPLDYERIESLRDGYASRHVDTRFAKIYLDGVPTGARSAAMLAPYRDHSGFPDRYRGVLHVDEATLAEDIAALETRGFTVKLHTAGDRSVRCALNAIERAHRVSGRADLRHELAHTGFVDPEDIPRFSRLNVAADLSPYIWFPSPMTGSIHDALGDRADRYWPIRELLEAGASLLAGSDWPAAVSSMDPWIGIATMVSRRDPSEATPGALWPEQAIGLEDALRIFTLDGARAMRRDHEAGSLQVGKSADLIVLSHNLFEIETKRIAETEVEMTLFEGEVVFQREHAGPA